MRRLSLRDKAAQLIMPWLATSYAPFEGASFADARYWVDSLHVGAIITGAGSPLEIAAKVNNLQHRSRLPLLIASDLEAGTAIRFLGGTAFPTNMGVAATGRDRDAETMGRITAAEARAVGVQVVFAPVADVNNNPANPIINTRSFGEEPARVARLVAAEVTGLQAAGVIAVPKHFPGHGDTGTDTHLQLPSVPADWARLDTVELPPFRAAIRAGALGVMSAHIALPNVPGGRDTPATLAPQILTGILRDSLHFDGFIATDALNMGGVINPVGADEAVVRALEAGADLLVMPPDAAAAIDAIERAVRAGRLTEARLDRSVRRLLLLKRRVGLFRRRTVPLDSVPAIVGRPAHDSAAREIARRAVVLASDDGAIERLRRSPQRLAIIAFADGAAGSENAGAIIAQALRARGDTVAFARITLATPRDQVDSAIALAGRHQTVLFVAAVRAVDRRGWLGLTSEYAELLERTARERNAILVSLGSPYIVLQAPSIRNYLLAWSAWPPGEAAAAGALTGAAISGTLPIRIPPRFSAGEGLAREAIR